MFEIGEVHILIHTWMASTDPLQAAMGKRMKEKFDKYWGSWHEKKEKEDDMRLIVNEGVKGKKDEKEKENINLLIFVAAVLDPRYKLSDYTKITIEEMYGLETGEKVWVAVNKCVRELFEEYRLKSSSPAVAETSTEQALSEGGGSKMKQLIANRLRQSNATSGGSKSELDKYLAEDCEDPQTKLDILAWWSVNSSRFPTLGKMAHDILAISISTMASESAFSTSGRILDDFRTSLTPFMIQALVCTQDWLRRSTDPVDIQEDMEALQELENGMICCPCAI
jgi:hypothetical protein